MLNREASDFELSSKNRAVFELLTERVQVFALMVYRLAFIPVKDDLIDF